MSSATRTDSNSSPGVPDTARRLAGRLAEAFERDQVLAERVNDAQHRLQAANGETVVGPSPRRTGAAL